MTLNDALNGVSKVGIDASVIIDLVEADPTTIAVLGELFLRIERSELLAIGSVILLTEVLVRAGGNPTREAVVRDLLALLDLRPVDVAIAERALVLRRTYRFATPDALHLATALESGCHAFVSSDIRHFPRASNEIAILVPRNLTV
jgi:predicted nucleic acid-binding protein